MPITRIQSSPAKTAPDLLQCDARGPYLVIRAEMQAILNDPELKAPVEVAFAAVEKRLPLIREQTRAALAAALPGSAPKA